MTRRGFRAQEDETYLPYSGGLLILPRTETHRKLFEEHGALVTLAYERGLTVEEQERLAGVRRLLDIAMEEDRQRNLELIRKYEAAQLLSRGDDD